jgi:IS5 family transposase
MSDKQLGLVDYEQTTVRRRTEKERFLTQMEAVVTYKALINLIEPTIPRPAPKEAGLPIRWKP